MIRVSEETGQPLFVAYYRRTLPAFLKVKELINNETIGKPLSVNIRLYKAYGENDRFPEHQHWHVNPAIGGAGHFYDLASHQFDYLDFVFGPITQVSGIAGNIAGYYSAEDTVSAVFTFASGVIGTGSWSFVVDKQSEEDSIEIIGTKGKIKFPCFDKGDVEVVSEKETEKLNFQHHENISFYLIEQVVGALRGKNDCVSTMYSAARTSFVLEEIVKSYYKKG